MKKKTKDTLEAFWSLLVIFGRSHDSDEVTKKEAFTCLTALEKRLRKKKSKFVIEAMAEWSMIKRFYEREKGFYLDNRNIGKLTEKLGKRIHKGSNRTE